MEEVSKLLSTDRSPDDRKNTRPDHRANTKRSERNRAQSLLQLSLRLFRVGDQLVDGLATEKLVVRGSRTPLRGSIGDGRYLSQRGCLLERSR